MYGRTMIARISPAASMLLPYVGPLKSGITPRCSVSRRKGITSSRSSGISTKMPQSPYTTLGIAARRSTRNATGWRSHRGANSERKIATPSASGVAMTSAMIDVTIVPKIAGAAPNRC